MADSKDVIITTVEGFPGFKDLTKMMKDIKTKEVVTAPFLLVAGDHALNDMAGDSPESLKSTLIGLGYNVHTMLKGIAEYESVRNVFVRHVREAMN